MSNAAPHPEGADAEAQYHDNPRALFNLLSSRLDKRTQVLVWRSVQSTSRLTAPRAVAGRISNAYLREGTVWVLFGKTQLEIRDGSWVRVIDLDRNTDVRRP